jgi:lactate dehydrogenase-like 2-hydroxyacid dehydrogenase
MFVARRFTDRVEAEIARRFEVRRLPGDLPVTADGLASAAAGCSHIMISATERVPAAVLEALAPSLKVVATLSVGYDHVDLEAARQHGIAVLTTPDVLSAACADLVLMHILNVARRGYESDVMVRTGAWQGWAPTQMLGQQLSGRRLAILGMGRIGREVARRGRGFGMEIHYHNRKRLPEAEEVGARYHPDLEDFLRAADVLCICAPGCASLVGFVNRRSIALLPDKAIVVNIARGEMVDDNALIEALQSGRLFGAGLDVFAGEPAIDRRYAALPNVFLSPHIGSATAETRDAMGALLLDGIAAIERGEWPANRIC